MNPCPFADRLDAYADGELPPAAATEVRDHLPACPACREQLRRIEALSGLIRAPSAAASPAALSRLHEAVESWRARSLQRTAEWFAGAAAAAVLVLAAGLAIWSKPAPASGQTPAWESRAFSQADASADDAETEDLVPWEAQDLARGRR